MTVMCNYELQNKLSNMMSEIKYRVIWLNEKDVSLMYKISNSFTNEVGRNLEFDLILNFSNSLYNYDGTN